MTKKAEWLAIKPGMIVKAPSGLLRVVRKVTAANSRRQTPMRKLWVTLTIQHCSWTHRPYTLYNVGELAQLGYVITGASWPLNTPFDRAFGDELEECHKDSAYRPQFDCCDVAGIG